ncbi:hypothetical protein O3Q52_00195 [Streptomyces sp. ActVer]|uniref:hypothetical protein n=1 Tax=Streptomyces sp. ActVer TaxID=3014558 RepID=UPI0022B2B7A0|nr:hypothetical protein [Streptomyces sp. ActVer]MCZ4506656.1 hypothetical protein [Streptomyces sp. ActVer]
MNTKWTIHGAVASGVVSAFTLSSHTNDCHSPQPISLVPTGNDAKTGPQLHPEWRSTV